MYMYVAYDVCGIWVDPLRPDPLGHWASACLPQSGVVLTRSGAVPVLVGGHLNRWAIRLEGEVILTPQLRPTGILQQLLLLSEV